LIPFPLDRRDSGRASLLAGQSETVSAEDYQRLWTSFINEAGQIPSVEVSTLLALLRKYTWAIPFDIGSEEGSDISVYAHSKATAAIASCLLKGKLSDDDLAAIDTAFDQLLTGGSPSSEAEILKRPLFTLVKGDISGTQDFLYLLTSSGAARGLRGRSFYLQLLTETIALWLLRRFDMSSTNLLFAGGGHFYVLLPHQVMSQGLDDLRQEITRRLWKTHGGDLSVIVDAASISPWGFFDDGNGSNIASKWTEVSKRVHERKRKRCFDFGDRVLMQLFEARQRGLDAQSTCQVCHGEWDELQDKLDDDVRKCRRCEGFEYLGQKLRDPVYLITFAIPDAEPRENGDWADVLRGFGTRLLLLDKNEKIAFIPPKAEFVTVSTLDSTDFLDEQVFNKIATGEIAVAYDFRFLPNATPRKENDQIADFEDLANASEGVKWLGVLRMDVDSLSEVIKSGFGEAATIARISTLSQSLRLFFEGWVPQLCRQFNRVKQGGKDQVYLIYAGGDDLFIVGAWSALPDLAKKIRDDFRDYVGGNQVTLSAGIAIEHQKYPLYQLAADSKHALDDRAKEFKRKDGPDKDAICFLQLVAGWEQFKHIEAWKDKIKDMLKPQGEAKAIPRSFLMRLGEIHYLYAENARYQRHRRRVDNIGIDQIEEEIRYAKWVWRSVYQLSRFKEMYPDFKNRIDELHEEILRNGLIENLNVISRWTELLTREAER
jgi:CRISPR-associated protein Csm1